MEEVRDAEERAVVTDEASIESMFHRSPAMEEVLELIRQVAPCDVPVYLEGETGTGKDVASRIIHRLSRRSEGPYLPVHLGAVPSELVGSELFGHERGTFTGADAQHAGKFEQADGGTLFLDEIGTLDARMQVSLLRVIEQGKFYRLGGTRSVDASVRLISASNQDLAEAVHEGTFREDLYYRLNVFRIRMPPLRERKEDIRPLWETFLQDYARSYGKEIPDVSDEVAQILEEYRWPGNIREMRNVIHRAVLICEGDSILTEHLPERLAPNRSRQSSREVLLEVGTPLREMERRMILQTLAAQANNRTRTAVSLGISRRALYTKMSKHGIR